MRLIRFGVALALACTTQPVLAATLAPEPGRAAFGVAAKAYVRLPLGKGGDAEPAIGLATALSRQDYDAAGRPRGVRRDADTLGLRLGFDGLPALTLAGASLRRRDGARQNLRWQTVAIVTGGLVLAAAATVAYLLHEANEHSD